MSNMVVQAAMVLMMFGVGLAFIRMARGPTLPDRIVAFDLVSIQVLGIICATAILSGRPLFLDAAIILALLAFLATVAFARYIERRAAALRGDAPA